MTTNFPGPYEIRLYYTCTPPTFASMQHSARYNLQVVGDPPPGTAFNAINALRRDASQVLLSTWVNAWVALLQPVFPLAANNTFDFAELWRYEFQTFNATFISAFAINLPGTSVSNGVAAAEYIITYRTSEGGIMRQHFQETILPGGARDTVPLANAAMDAIAAQVISTQGVWIARDTSFPFATIAGYPGQNEAVFKKRFRP